MALMRRLRNSVVGRELAPGRHGYALLLVLIIVSIGFELAAVEGELTHLVTIVLQGATFLAALWTSQARTRLLHVGTAAVIVITIGAAVAFAAEGRVDAVGARVTGLLLLIFAPVVIIHGLVGHFREEGRVTVQTMFGVLCIYLLIGSLFAGVYGVIDDAGSAGFFAQINNGNTSDFLYFSFTTMTTTGYGDLTAASDLGRSFAITEQLLGQIYLVTVVAVIVGNLRRTAAGRAS